MTRHLPLLLLAIPGEAAAHEACTGCAAPPEAWDGTLALALLGAVGAIWAVGLCRLWSRAGFGRGVRLWRAGLFAVGRPTPRRCTSSAACCSRRTWPGTSC